MLIFRELFNKIEPGYLIALSSVSLGRTFALIIFMLSVASLVLHLRYTYRLAIDFDKYIVRFIFISTNLYYFPIYIDIKIYCILRKSNNPRQ